MRQAAAAVSVGTYWPWEPTATLWSAGAVGSAARGASTPTDVVEVRGHIVAADCLQLVTVYYNSLIHRQQISGSHYSVEGWLLMMTT